MTAWWRRVRWFVDQSAELQASTRPLCEGLRCSYRGTMKKDTERWTCMSYFRGSSPAKRRGLPRRVVLGPAAVGEEPEPVAQEIAAEGGFPHVIDRALPRLQRGRLRGPTRAAQRVAQRPGELVAARLRDRAHDAAAEAAVLRGDGARDERRLLDGVLDVHRPHLSPRRLRDDDAVDQD